MIRYIVSGIPLPLARRVRAALAAAHVCYATSLDRAGVALAVDLSDRPLLDWLLSSVGPARRAGRRPPAERRPAMSAQDDLPPELLAPLLALWQQEQPIVVRILPRDAWIAVGILQFATRNPAISPTQRRLIVQFGRELQRALAAFDPIFDRYMELGWDPSFDVPLPPQEL